MSRFGLCAASSLISEERGVCCSYFILSKVVDRVIFKTWRQFLCHWARSAWSYFSRFPCVPRYDQLKTWAGSHKASKFMALLSIDLKQLGCCSRPMLKSPLTVRTFYATSPRKRVQDNLNFISNHVNSNPANTNDFLVSFGVKVSGYLLKGRNVTALVCFPPKLAFFQGLEEEAIKNCLQV